MQPLTDEIVANTSTICHMSEDEDMQDITEDNSDDPQTRKRDALTTEPIVKKKGRTNEEPLSGSIMLVANITESGANTAATPNTATTIKESKTMTSVEISNAAENAAPQPLVIALMNPTFYIIVTPSPDQILAPKLSTTTSVLNSRR